MNKALFILIFFCCIPSGSFAQKMALDWLDHYAGYKVGDDNVYPTCITTDQAGNVYTSGTFSGTVDFDGGPAVNNLTATHYLDGFVTKTDASGALIWVKQFKSSGGVNKISVQVDKTDNVFICGTFVDDVDCDPGPGAWIVTGPSSNVQLFIVQLNSAGNFQWAKATKTSTGQLEFSKSKMDHDGNLLIMGSFSGQPDIDPGAAIVNLGPCSGSGSYVLKLANNGDFKWAKSIGEVCSAVTGMGLTVDSRNNVYTTGTYLGIVDMDPGPGVAIIYSAVSPYLYISKLDSNGDFIRVISTGSAYGGDQSNDIAADKADNIYITGLYRNQIDFDPGPDTVILRSPGGIWGNNLFVSSYDSSGKARWAKSFNTMLVAGSSAGQGLALDCDSNCNINTLGLFVGGQDFDPGPGTAILRARVAEEFFILQLDSAGGYRWAGQLRGLTKPESEASIHADAYGHLYTCGTIMNTTDFDPGADTLDVFPVSSDGFLQKLGICHPYDTAEIKTCRSYTLEGHTYTASGTYTQVIRASHSCDVSLTFQLVLDTVNDTVIRSGNTLMAKGTGTSYHWVLCPGYTEIAGANTSVYTASVDGDYALIITNGSCTDTSDCITVIGTGLMEVSSADRQLQLLPNPTRNATTLVFSEPAQQARIELLSLTGQLLSVANFSGKEFNLNMGFFPPGIYLVKIIQEGSGIVVEKLLKQ